MIPNIPNERSADWFRFEKELRRRYSSSTWVPLRACVERTVGDLKSVGYVSDGIFVGTAAFSSSNRKIGEKSGWSEIGIGSSAAPYAFSNGTYKLASEYQFHDGQTVGHNLVFDSSNWNPELSSWIIDPDLVLALKLVKEGNTWFCPKENFVDVIREEQDKRDFRFISIRREWLLDYLSARRLNLRLSTYCQRVENYSSVGSSPFEKTEIVNDEHEEARRSLIVTPLNNIFGGEVAVFQMGHVDFDEDEDAPDLSKLGDENTYSKTSRHTRPVLEGIRVEGEFWRNEWLDHNNTSVRVRGDLPKTFPMFVTETDGTEVSSNQLADEDIGRWLYFRTNVISALLNNRGFTLKWYTNTTASVVCENDISVHFGVNERERIVVYAYDIARLEPWHQKIWQSHNITPDGGVGQELGAAQIKSEPSNTEPPEAMARIFVERIAHDFEAKFGVAIFGDYVMSESDWQKISRFTVNDDASLLRLAKEIHRAFGDRLNKKNLNHLVDAAGKNELGSLKLLEKLCASTFGIPNARNLMSPLFGIYDLRIGDAHPTGSKIEDAFKMCGVDRSLSIYSQAYQLISGFSEALSGIGYCLFSSQKLDQASKS
jgi:hypothetical protein